MKVRRVMITVELESNEAIKDLKDAVVRELTYSTETTHTEIVQIQANVIRKGK